MIKQEGMVIVYSYNIGDGEDIPYFTTFVEAKASAQVAADYYGFPVAVVKQVVAKLPARELAVALLERTGWCAHSEDACTVKPRPKRDAATDLHVSS